MVPPIYSHNDVLVVYFSQQGNDNFSVRPWVCTVKETAEIEAGDATPGPDMDVLELEDSAAISNFANKKKTL